MKLNKNRLQTRTKFKFKLRTIMKIQTPTRLKVQEMMKTKLKGRKDQLMRKNVFLNLVNVCRLVLRSSTTLRLHNLMLTLKNIWERVTILILIRMNLSNFWTLISTKIDLLRHFVSRFTEIVVYFNDDHFIESKRSELYGWTNFLSNCGGSTKLFLSKLVLSSQLYFRRILRITHGWFIIVTYWDCLPPNTTKGFQEAKWNQKSSGFEKENCRHRDARIISMQLKKFQ